LVKSNLITTKQFASGAIYMVLDQYKIYTSNENNSGDTKMSKMTQYVQAIWNGNANYMLDPTEFVFGKYISDVMGEDDFPENDTKEEWREVFDFDEVSDWESVEDYVNEKFGYTKPKDMVSLEEEAQEFETPFDYFWDMVTKEVVATEE